MRVTRWRHRATPTSEGDPTGRRPARQGLQVSLRPENGKIIPSMPEQQPPGRLGMCAEGPFWAGFGPAGLPARSGLPSDSFSRFRCRRLAVNGAKRPRIQMIEFRENLERAKGFEPSTPTLARRRRRLRQGIRHPARARIHTIIQSYIRRHTRRPYPTPTPRLALKCLECAS